MPIQKGTVNIGGKAEGSNNQVTLVSNTSTAIKSANAKRKRLLIKNIDPTNTCYVGFGTVSIANGYALFAKQEVLIRSTKAVNGIGDGTNDVDISYIEE